MQHARRGEDISRQIADDATVSESVLMTNYVKETDEESRHPALLLPVLLIEKQPLGGCGGNGGWRHQS